MKKILLISIITLSTLTIFAQPSLWVGGHLGVNFCTINGKLSSDDNTKKGYIAGPMFGLVTAYSVNDLFSVVAEINYVKAGSTSDFKGTYEDGQEFDIKNTNTFNTIQIPLMAKLTFGKNIQFFAYGGVYWSFALNGKYKVESDALENTSGKIIYGERPENYDGDILYADPEYNRRSDFGLNLGAGIQKEIGPGIFILDFRFGQGFTDRFKYPNEETPDGYKPYLNRSFGLNASYIINLGS